MSLSTCLAGSSACALRHGCYAALGGLAMEQGRELQGWSAGRNLLACMEACDAVSGCSSFSFDASAGACWLKDAVLTANSTSQSDRLMTYYATPCECYDALGGLAATEGNHLATLVGVHTVHTCGKACDALASCHSFTFDPADGRCDLKDRRHDMTSSATSSTSSTTYFATNVCPPPPSTPSPPPPLPQPLFWPALITLFHESQGHGSATEAFFPAVPATGARQLGEVGLTAKFANDADDVHKQHMMKSDARSDWALILVDVCDGLPLSHVASQLILALSRSDEFDMRRFTLWTSRATKLAGTRVTEHLKQPPKFLPPLVSGHEGKTHALLSHDESHVVVLDGDVRPCPGWTSMVSDWIRSGEDVLWTIAPFGGGFSGYVNRTSNFSVTPMSRTQREQFSTFKERNTGTIFGVKRSHATRSWLHLSLVLYDQLAASGRVGVFKLPNSETRALDQPSLRESFFVMHTQVGLTERLAPGNQACRRVYTRMSPQPYNDLGAACSNRTRCPCSCTRCKLLHSKGVWDQCRLTFVRRRSYN